MKMLSWTASAMLLLMAMACTGNKGATSQGDDVAADSTAQESDTLVFETIEWNDSTEYKVKIVDYSSDEEPAPYTVETAVDRDEVITLQAVAGPAAAVKFVNQWLTLDAAGCAYPDLLSAEEIAEAYGELKKETGVTDVRSALKHRKSSDSAEEEDEDEMQEMAWLSGNEYSASINLVWQTKALATLCDSGYDYSAGAVHGMPWNYNRTFDLKNLRILSIDDIFVEKGRDALLKMVIAELKEDYADAWDMVTEDIDFPGIDPSLVVEGVQFDYGAYEIGAYALGMPSVVLPYEKVKQFLTPGVKELLGME